MRRSRTRLVAAVALACAGLMSSCGSAGSDTAVPASTLLTSGDCPREEALVQEALDAADGSPGSGESAGDPGRSVEADVSGDGVPDRVVVASDPFGEQGCRGFVAVRVSGGSAYSTHLFRLAVPLKGLPARVIATPRLSGAPGALVVVDTGAAVDALLAQMFTLTDSGLEVVQVPPFRDGTFIVEGGGVVHPQGTACTADGRLVRSEAELTSDGQRYRVTRRTYELTADRLGVGDPTVETGALPADQLVERFPEFGRSHWDDCTGAMDA